MKKISLLLFFAVFILSFWVRLTAVKNGNFPFTIDQGRDLIDIRSIAVGGKPRLIGPTTSINGVFLGPLWYYFNLPPFIATGGDPAAPLLWQIVWYQLAGLSVYFLIKRTNENLAFFAAAFFLLMPLGFNTNRYFWNANAMPIFTAFYLLSLYLVSLKTNLFRAALLGLAAGLALQIEAAFGIIFFPFSFLFLLFTTRKIKVHLGHLFAFLATLLPQVLFELRHGFSMTKIFLSEAGGGSSLLGKKMTLGERLSDRWEII
ncbi:MAG: glycosyltransferase family 39 protein, partial [Microgenomates group bacterium]